MTIATCETGVPPRRRPEIVCVRAADPASLQEQLDAAVEGIRPAAVRSRCGILVTRWDWSLFTVEASPSVPCGVTVERDRWRRTRDGAAAPSETAT